MDNTRLNAIAGDLKDIASEVKKREAMQLHTSFKIGGEADIYATVSDVNQLKDVLLYVKQNNLPLLILGNGSNMLVSDEGISGIALKLDGQFRDISVNEDGSIRAGAAAMLSALCSCALEHSLTGLEFAWGIPGSVGGAAYMNAGAYGGELKDIVTTCEYVTFDGESGVFETEQCDFGYRTSAFQRGGYVITAVNLKLNQGEQSAIRAAMDGILSRRKSKQPLEYPSAGSVFKRPVGYYAGGLIEQCGLKGFSVGGAQVSEKHAGFIINRDRATCKDVLGLVHHIQETVKRETGVELECEIRTYGRQTAE